MTDASSLITTEYSGNYIYEGGVLQFFNTAEGYAEPKGLGWEYVFQYKDHLGNIRLSYSDADGNGLIAQTEIREENNFYPFGLKHKGYNSAQSGRDHKYGFGNKEEQDELGLGWIDITARNYDPALGRWMNLDPLAEAMRRHSPYNYAFDNPVYFIDPDGNLPQPGKQETDATRSQREELDKQKKQEDIQKALGFLVDKGVIKNDTSSGTSGEAKVGSVEGGQGTFGAPISEDGGGGEATSSGSCPFPPCNENDPPGAESQNSTLPVGDTNFFTKGLPVFIFEAGKTYNIGVVYKILFDATIVDYSSLFVSFKNQNIKSSGFSLGLSASPGDAGIFSRLHSDQITFHQNISGNSLLEIFNKTGLITTKGVGGTILFLHVKGFDSPQTNNLIWETFLIGHGLSGGLSGGRSVPNFENIKN